MNCIIPFEKEVKFAGPVKEICSISLEHEITPNEHEILGNFIVSGTYKEHELSVNTSDFRFVIPFNVELTNRIEEDSLEFSIDNFTYDINEDKMVVKIDYIVYADDIREEVIDPFDLIDETEPVIEPEIIEAEDVKSDDNRYEETISETYEKEEAINNEIISNINAEEDYMTYHIHIVKENESIDSIAMNYKITKDELSAINNIDNIIVNDKLIIPMIDE